MYNIVQCSIVQCITVAESGRRMEQVTAMTRKAEKQSSSLW